MRDNVVEERLGLDILVVIQIVVGIVAAAAVTAAL